MCPHVLPDRFATTPSMAVRKPFEMTYAGRLAMFVVRVSYPGGHSVWLTRRFPTVAWGLKKDAVPFPTEADAARTIARLRPSGPVSIEPIAPEIARSA